MAAVCKAVGSPLLNRWSQGQSNPSKLRWLPAGMADMGAMHDRCTWTDVKHRVGDTELIE